jgi:DNA excision repair protein ERCC-6-like 2
LPHRTFNPPLTNKSTGIVGRRSDNETDSEVEITAVKPSACEKGKRKAGERVEWSDEEEGENAFERFKNRKSTKRKKLAATKKALNTKAKDAVASRKQAKENNGEASKKKERMWGDVEDYDSVMDDEIPDYVQDRRREFDRSYQTLQEAGLKLPPQYDDISFSDDERLVELDERPDFPTVEASRAYKDIELPHSAGVIPASIARYLRDYQVEGVAFLHELFVYQKGGILGDDMGLGKTVQVAAFLTAAFGKTGDERDSKRMRKMRRVANPPWYPRILIVCPGSLMQNWENELTRWGWWHIDKFYGNPAERNAVLQATISGRLEVVITTYHTYRIHKGQLNMVKWDCVVADECHIIKERSSETTQAMNEVNALCRIGLTGTAIQNKYEELWTLLNWTNPGRFGPISTWVSSISDPLRIGQSHDATYHQLKQARQTAKKLVQNLLPQFFLRRMKSLIAHQLPKKTDKVVFCPLSEIQKDAYERFLDSDIVEIVKESSKDCDCGSGNKRGWCCYTTLQDSNTKWQALVFPVIATLQKLSNHLALLIPNSKDVVEKQQRDLEYLQKIVPDRWKELYESRESLKNLSNPEFCGKWKILKKLLTFWKDNGDKVLIFSHSVRLLKMLEHMFNHTSYNVSFLSGAMPNEDRQKTVDDFNSDPGQFVFLISTKAGGVGLNITSANKVVIFDPNWNPSYDLQAQDRAYRIGQLRDVEVFRLVSAGTVEEIVYARQIYKQQQANIGYNASTERRYFKGVQSAPGQKGEIFGLDNLLTFHGDDIVLRDIVNKTNVAEAKRGVDILDFDMDDALNDEDNPLKVDDDDKGDGAMSQLAALLTEGEDKKKKPKPRPKTDAIQAILAAAGVEYTHENSEVVGSSRVEAELSRRAEEAGNDVDYGEERLFAESQSFVSDPGKIHYQFHPPDDVMMKQFCTMAKMFGFASATEFAFVVEGWTQKQRTDCLERFYLKRKERLAEMGELENSRVESNGMDTTADVTGDDVMDEISALLERDVAENAAVVAENDVETEDDDDDEL